MRKRPPEPWCNGDDGRIVKRVVLKAGDGQVMDEVLFHFLQFEAFQIAAGHDARDQLSGRIPLS